MTPGQFLDAYAAGWVNGNAKMIMEACDPGYVLRDPAAPTPVGREEFAEYFRGLISVVAEARGKADVGEVPFMQLSDVQPWTDGELLMAWCQWKIPDTKISGAGLITVGAQGVVSEKIFYYARPAA